LEAPAPVRVIRRVRAHTNLKKEVHRLKKVALATEDLRAIYLKHELDDLHGKIDKLCKEYKRLTI